MRTNIMLAPVCAVLLLVACTAHDKPVPETKGTPVAEAEPAAKPEPKLEPKLVPKSEPKPEPKSEPVRVVQLTGAIASVSLVEDCPDVPPHAPTPAAEIAPAMPMKDQAMGDSPGHWSPPCQQSWVQLSLAHDGDIAQRISISAARLVDVTSNTPIATIPTRGPTRWDDAAGYVAWDEQLTAGPGIKASYKLAVPANLSAARVVLELDVHFDGRVVTLRSPEVQQEPPHVIVT
jgi:hypothetical protein